MLNDGKSLANRDVVHVGVELDEVDETDYAQQARSLSVRGLSGRERRAWQMVISGAKGKSLGKGKLVEAGTDTFIFLMRQIADAAGICDGLTGENTKNGENT